MNFTENVWYQKAILYKHPISSKLNIEEVNIPSLKNLNEFKFAKVIKIWEFELIEFNVINFELLKTIELWMEYFWVISQITKFDKLIKLSFYNDNLYSDTEFVSHNSSFEFKNFGFWQKQKFL